MRRSRRRVVDQLALELRPPRLSLSLLPWRWRWEAGLSTGVAAGVYELAEAVHPVAPVGALLTAVLVYFRSPPVRRFVDRRWWCISVQHRLRSGFLQAGVYNRSGRIPAIIWTSARPAGVRVLVWCPAGVDIDMIRSARSALAAACWAADVHVARHPRRADIVAVFVVKRPMKGG